MKRLLLILASLIVILSACGGGSSSAPVESSGDSASTPDSQTDGSSGKSSEQPLVLKFGHVLAPDHPYQLGAEKFKEIVESNAPEPISVEIYHSAQLGSERDLTEGLQLGTIDLAIAPGTIANFEPAMKILDLPYIFRDKEHAYKVLDGEIGDQLASGLPEKNLRLLAYWENGFRHITNNIRPIYTPDDLEGIKIRVPENPTYVDTFNNWNANVNTMAFGELFTALQQKTVDGQENPLALIYTSKFYEAQKYLSLSGHFYGPAQLLISEITWNKLSPEMQEVVKKAAEEARDYQRQIVSEKEEEYLQKLKDEGMEVNEVDSEAFIESVKPVWEKYRGEFGDLIDQIQNIN
ncbi:DctP family TRAP transporter solute-binding subunit [Aeribacillus sp. FSL K6-8394]|uniref:TRAP transporter substrate-binding protein n=1 Tax=Aeribacillus sp. FSL K6-8394 TaxID=2954570 RepID=UPI0030FC4ECB